MEYIVTLMQDPDPMTGNRMIPIGTWAQRPEYMQSERAFSKSNKEGGWLVITKIDIDTEAELATITFEDDIPLVTELTKMIYITEDQHERLIKFHADKMRKDIKDSSLDPAREEFALKVVEHMSNLEQTLPDQLEVEIINDRKIDIVPSAWGVVDKKGSRVGWLAITEINPFSMPNPKQELELADRANPEGAPHRWRVYFA